MSIDHGLSNPCVNREVSAKIIAQLMQNSSTWASVCHHLEVVNFAFINNTIISYSMKTDSGDYDINYKLNLLIDKDT